MRISVVTVCFNSAATIEATLRSVAAQTQRGFEHLVVDGGSTDGTLEIVRAWNAHPVRLLTGPDRGIYDAMNKGVAAATGDAVGFLNADDRYADADVLASIAAALERPGTDFVHGDLVFVDPATRRLLRYWRGAEFDPRRFRNGWLPPHPTLYVRRAAFEAAGPFTLAYRAAGDIEWMLRLLTLPGLRGTYIPRVLVEMDAGGVSNAGLRAFLHTNRDVWRSCARLGIAPARFVFGKTARKIPQWLHRGPPA
jgi:glycosyltransferase